VLLLHFTLTKRKKTNEYNEQYGILNNELKKITNGIEEKKKKLNIK